MKLFQKISQLVGHFRRHRVFKSQFSEFLSLCSSLGLRNVPLWKDRYPCLDDTTPNTGFDRHYIYHPAWAARILAQTRPAKHIDVSSTLHFCSIVSAFLPVEFFDYRPAQLFLSGLSSNSADLNNLGWSDGSVSSLSCMHVLEHVGLGRYGDPIDPVGDLKAIKQLIRVLAPGGSLLVVVPVGREKIYFNAHRVYDAKRFAEYFSELELIEFTLICESESGGGLIVDDAFNLASHESYGCGCFWFKRSLQGYLNEKLTMI